MKLPFNFKSYFGHWTTSLIGSNPYHDDMIIKIILTYYFTGSY